MYINSPPSGLRVVPTIAITLRLLRQPPNLQQTYHSMQNVKPPCECKQKAHHYFIYIQSHPHTPDMGHTPIPHTHTSHSHLTHIPHTHSSHSSLTLTSHTHPSYTKLTCLTLTSLTLTTLIHQTDSPGQTALVACPCQRHCTPHTPY